MTQVQKPSERIREIVNKTDIYSGNICLERLFITVDEVLTYLDEQWEQSQKESSHE